MSIFRFVDLFCGGGGNITRAINALNTAGMPYEGRGFNEHTKAMQLLERMA